MIDLALLKKPVFVREHGTWAMLIVPAITGIIHSPHTSLALLPFLIAIFFLFFAYTPAEILLTEIKNSKTHSSKYQAALLWFSIYFVIGLTGGIISVLYFQKYTLMLIGFGAVLCFAFGLFADNNFKSPLIRDISAIPGLSLIAPATYYFLTGKAYDTMLLLWLYNTIFFVSSALYIHTKMLQPNRDAANDRAIKYYRLRNFNSFYQLLLLLFILSLPALHKLSVMGALAFIPMIAHCSIGVYVFRRRVYFKHLGYAFAVYALFFALFFRL